MKALRGGIFMLRGERLFRSARLTMYLRLKWYILVLFYF